MAREETSAGEEILVLHERWVRLAREHLREIVAAVVGLVLVLSLVAGYRAYQNRRENKASLLYMQALSLKDPEKLRTKLQEIVRKYPGTVAAREARLNLWELALNQRSPLREELLKAIRKEARGAQKVSVWLGEGYLAEEKGDLSRALEAYQKALKEGSFSGAVVYGDLARVYEKEKAWQKALEAYQKYLAEKPSAGNLSFVEYRLAALKQKLTAQKQE